MIRWAHQETAEDCSSLKRVPATPLILSLRMGAVSRASIRDGETKCTSCVLLTEADTCLARHVLRRILCSSRGVLSSRVCWPHVHFVQHPRKVGVHRLDTIPTAAREGRLRRQDWNTRMHTNMHWNGDHTSTALLRSVTVGLATPHCSHHRHAKNIFQRGENISSCNIVGELRGFCCCNTTSNSLSMTHFCRWGLFSLCYLVNVLSFLCVFLLFYFP